jgi:hypothetical protein
VNPVGSAGAEMHAGPSVDGTEVRPRDAGRSYTAGCTMYDVPYSRSMESNSTMRGLDIFLSNRSYALLRLVARIDYAALGAGVCSIDKIK